MESSSTWIFLVSLPLLFFPPVSYSAVPLQSIDCYGSSRRLITSFLASFAAVRRRDCSCSSSRPLRSVRRLFLLFSLINSFSSHQVRFSLSIVSALLVARSASVRQLFLLFSSPVPLQSIDCLCSSRRLIASLLASFALVCRLVLLFSLMNLGGVRRKMLCRNCEHIDAVKTVEVYMPLLR